METTDYLINIRRIIKLHESMLKDICVQYHLSLIEANIISFLHNNPGKDTAGDIVELRMLSKGNVSQAVELLIQKSLLQRTPDAADRRKIHLSLLPSALPITEAVDAIREQYYDEIFYGFTEEEYMYFQKLNQRIMVNTENAVKRRESK